MKDNMLAFAVLCSLCVWTSMTVDAKALLMQDTTEDLFKRPDVSTPVPVMTTVQDTTEAPWKGPHVSTPVPIMTLVQDTTEAPLKGPSVSTPNPIMTLVQDTTEAPLKDPGVSTPVPMTTPAQDTAAVPEVHFEPQNTSINVPVKAPGITVQVSSGHYKFSSISLGMASDSVDDMYHGCSDKMLIKVKRGFLRESSKKEALFSKVTERCAAQALKVRDSYDSLSWDHFKALCAYTASAFTDLNDAVRKSKATYDTTFEFHALHFLLTDAIQLLKRNQRNCYTSYRRSKRDFMGEVGQTMRFGSFASSSLSTTLAHFGRRTCFEIHTCFGAFLKSYTEFGPDEQEVLIPPYEMFTIVSVDRSGENDLRCDVLYKLQTAGIHSSLNCQVAGSR